MYQEWYESELVRLCGSKDCSSHSHDDDTWNAFKEEVSEPHSSRVGDAIGELHHLDGGLTFLAYVESKECWEYGLYGVEFVEGIIDERPTIAAPQKDI